MPSVIDITREAHVTQLYYILYSINMKRHALPGLLVVSVKTSQNDPSCVLQ
jgi:hypothetical protein